MGRSLPIAKFISVFSLFGLFGWLGARIMRFKRLTGLSGLGLRMGEGVLMNVGEIFVNLLAGGFSELPGELRFQKPIPPEVLGLSSSSTQI